MAVENLKDALIHELRDILSAEQQMVQALPKMAKHAEAKELQTAFKDHLKETKNQVNRLKAAFKELKTPARAEKCEAMSGLVEEGEELMKMDTSNGVTDVLLIAAAQKVEHYEIASYGTAIGWAQQLKLKPVADLLKETLAEEKSADKKLNGIARKLNRKAKSA